MLDNSKIEKPVISKPLIGVACAVLIAALGAWYYWHSHVTPVAPPPVAAAVPSVPAAPPTEEPIQHPVPTTDVPKQVLPPLADSDVAFKEALAKAAPSSLSQYLVPDSIIRHIVVTVDNLSRQKLPLEKRPLVPAPGSFVVDGDELHATLDSANFERYQPFVGLIQKADMHELANLYLQYYPLFQQAYENLGYPNGYFNDRLIQVIDMLLATPQITGPIDLVRPNVMYVFADPTLEARPAGQKILIRMGSDNADAVKAKLTELRSIIAAAPPRRR
jgi:hypothetical protein